LASKYEYDWKALAFKLFSMTSEHFNTETICEKLLSSKENDDEEEEHSKKNKRFT